MADLVGSCPECGKELHIPQELDSFSCLYCGARLTREAFTTPISQDVLPRLRELLGACITVPKNTIRYLTPKEYSARFDSYMEDYGTVLELLDALPSEHRDSLSLHLLDHVENTVSGKKGAYSLLEDIKYTVCLLFVPAVCRAAPVRGKKFCECFRKAWLERYPKQVFQLTTYEQIAEGFVPRKLCYITTAVCRNGDMPDDCAALSAFREFRDQWLSNQPDGEKLISDYYQTAPSIVTAINATDPDSVYPVLWRDHLQPCLEAIRKGDPMECKKRYCKMVEDLQARYFGS